MNADETMSVLEAMGLISDWQERHRAALAALEAFQVGIGERALLGMAEDTAIELAHLAADVAVSEQAVIAAKLRLPPAQRAERLARAEALRLEAAADIAKAEAASVIFNELGPRLSAARNEMEFYARQASGKELQAASLTGDV